MADAAAVNAYMLAFWNGIGGDTWVERQAHTDTILTPVTDALLAFAAPRAGERVLDIGCGCGAATLDFARAVGPEGRVEALDISGSMLAEGKRRAQVAGISNIEWRQADAASAELDQFDLLVSAFGTMFFGNAVAAFSHMREAAAPNARMALVSWAPLAENHWMQVPMDAVRPHIPPRPKGTPNAPGMFAFADPAYVAALLTSAGWAEPRFEKLEADLDIAAGRGLEEAVLQSTTIGAVNSWLRREPDEVKVAATQSIREALAPHAEGDSVKLPGACWLIASVADWPSQKGWRGSGAGLGRRPKKPAALPRSVVPKHNVLGNAASPVSQLIVLSRTGVPTEATTQKRHATP
jgi:SAM-dependent methyltransferase